MTADAKTLAFPITSSRTLKRQSRINGGFIFCIFVFCTIPYLILSTPYGPQNEKRILPLSIAISGLLLCIAIQYLRAHRKTRQEYMATGIPEFVLTPDTIQIPADAIINQNRWEQHLKESADKTVTLAWSDIKEWEVFSSAGENPQPPQYAIRTALSEDSVLIVRRTLAPDDENALLDYAQKHLNPKIEKPNGEVYFWLLVLPLVLMYVITELLRMFGIIN